MFSIPQDPLATWRPASGTTAGTTTGWTANSTGTVSHPTLATTNVQTQSRRTRWTSTTSANAVGGLVSATTMCWRGNAERKGGFCFVARFSLSANPTGTRAFVGLSALSTNICAVDPSSAANTIGIGFDAGDSAAGTWYFIRKDGTTLQKIALDGTGGTGAASRNTTDVYEVILFALSNAAEVYVSLVNVSTGAMLYLAVVSTFLPGNTTFLNAHAQAGRGGSSGTATQFELLFLDMFAGVVPSVAALRLASSGRPDRAQVQGFAKPGDGGGGDFLWQIGTPPFVTTNIVATGTSPPQVYFSGTAVNFYNLRIEITTGGVVPKPVGGTDVLFRWSTNGGSTWVQQNVAAGDVVPLSGSGLTANFSHGTYTSDNVYTSTSKDDGGINIIPPNQAIGWWQRQYSGAIDVRWFGAVGDGVTDCLSAFNDAMKAVGSGTGGTLFIPAGNYYLSNTLNVIRPIKLVGAASDHFIPTSQLLFADGVVGIMTWHGAMGSPDGGRADGCTIEALTVTAVGKTTPTAHGLYMRTPTRVVNCHFTGFGGHGICIQSAGGGFPNNWYVSWTRCSANLGDGIHVDGNDTNVGLCDHGDFQNNVGWGVVDSSFLGCSWMSVHTAENETGAFFRDSTPGSSSFIGCYSEQDQPPSHIGGNAFIIGGIHAAGFTPSSGFFGGGAPLQLHTGGFSGSGNWSDILATGTNPPRVALQGTSTGSGYYNIRIEVTTAGYPGGIQPNGTPGTQGYIRWSIDNGVNWNGPVAIPRANNTGGTGIHPLALGASGMYAYFTPGFYSLDNVFTAQGPAGSPVQFNAGSQDGTFAAFSWQGTDPDSDSYPFRMRWNASLKRWQIDWANSRTNTFLASRWSLPNPGLMTFGSLWFGNPAGVQNQITSADGGFTPGSLSWQASTYSPIGWWNPGDLVLNYSGTTRWPVAWRPTQRCGIGATAFGIGAAWRPSVQVYPGESVVVTSGPMTGKLFRALAPGVSGATEPNWSLAPSIGQTLNDGGAAGVTWENAGSGTETLDPLIVASPQMLTKDCSSGGTITLSAEEIAHERYKLTGTPAAAFTIIIGPGAGGSWDRAFSNATAQAATVKASAGDPGVSVPAAGCYRLFHDGTAVLRVT